MLKERVDIRQIINWCHEHRLPNTALYFIDYRNNSHLTENEWWIEKAFVVRHVGDDIFQRMQSDGVSICVI